jgi:hypothetical protein
MGNGEEERRFGAANADPYSKNHEKVEFLEKSRSVRSCKVAACQPAKSRYILAGFTA